MLISSPDFAPMQSIAPAAGASVAACVGASVAADVGASVAADVGASVAGGWVAAGVAVAPPHAVRSMLTSARMPRILLNLNISSSPNLLFDRLNSYRTA